jgi:hypothetical protein
MAAKSKTQSKSRGSKAKETTDHQTIRRWAEERGAHPATVIGTTSDTTGVLRLDFPGYSGKDTLKEVSWKDFFKKFDRAHLSFLYQDKTASGRKSRFCKFISGNGGAKR